MRDWTPSGASSKDTCQHAHGPRNSGRLPGNVKPLHYTIVLEPDLDEGRYSGSVDIDVEILEETSTIYFHNVDLDISTAAVYHEHTRHLALHRADVGDEMDMLQLAQSLPRGSKARVHMVFKGSLTRTQGGFYRGSYLEKGKEIYYGVTQMQATEARRAIPCFDEPALKATYTLVMVVDDHLTVLGNMDEDSTHKMPPNVSGKVKKRVTFKPTPLMSTYLLAWVVGPFYKHVENNDFHIPIKVWTTPDRNIHDGQYAADLTAKALDFYESTFGAKYPLPKLDLVGVAARGGAMENWGLILFQDRALLVDESVATASSKVLISEVVLHEEAHLWFGDLVTTEWWESIWLNESFATWVAWFALNTFRPEWQIWNTFMSSVLQQALTLDSLRSSHPIEVPVESSGQINQIFDAISYQKGASVLRMLSTYLGEGIFLEGVRRYIKAHAFGNAKTVDLWKGLSEASGEDVAQLMQPWTKNIGFPVITVTEDELVGLVFVTQNRFLRTGPAEPEDDTILWPIFLGVRTDDAYNPKVMLTGRSGHFQVSNIDFFKLNSDHTNVYRTLYTPSRLMKLAGAARFGKLSVADRAGLVGDSIALSVSGHQQSNVTFYFINAMRDDSSFFVWLQMVEWFHTLHTAWLFEPEEVKTALDFALRDLIEDKVGELGWDFSDDDPDDNITPQFRTLVFTAAGYAGNRSVVVASRDLFHGYFHPPQNQLEKDKHPHSTLNPNLRAPVFGITLHHSGADVAAENYDLVLNEYRNARTTEARVAAMTGLGHARQPELVKRSVELLFDKTVPWLETFTLILSLTAHRPGAEALFDILLSDKKWGELQARAPSGLGGLSRLIAGIGGGLTTEKQASQLETAFDGRSKNGLEKVLAQAVEEARVRAGWVERSRGQVEGYLRGEGYLKRRRGENVDQLGSLVVEEDVVESKARQGVYLGSW